MSRKGYLDKRVKVFLSVSEEQVKANIAYNMANIPVWFSRMFYPNGYKAYIVSAGPSMEKYVEELKIKDRMEHPHRDFIIMCVKHALPRLLAMGIEPDFCVLLDGRPLDEESTHGVLRRTLFEKIPEKTIFLVASMSNPGYAEYLQANGARVMGWHTQVTGLDSFMHLIKEPIVSGGTSSGTRCIALAHLMGIREMTLVGFDSCLHNPTPAQLAELDDKGRKKYIDVDMAVDAFFDKKQEQLLVKLTESYAKLGLEYKSTISKRFYTTGELLAQAQDFEDIFGNATYDIKFNVFDDGLVNHMFQNMPGRAKRDYSFVEYFKKAVPRRDLSILPKKTLKKKKPEKAKKKGKMV